MSVTARQAEQAIITAVITWEAAALATGRVPTLTSLARSHRRWLVPAATALLALHLWLAPEPPARPSDQI